jgi:DnaD/phage-associated family protein
MEQQGDYITKEEIEEGLAMIGKGYEDQPSVVVEPPRRRIERRGKEMLEVEEAAYVKFSTEFKAELADLDVYALKVFIYIGLSINFESGTAYPGVRKIAKETGMNKDTVGKAIEELESKGFLQVRRKDGSSNIYKPECYFAIGETVPSGRTPPELSGVGVKLSDENGQLSGASRVKDAQQDKQDKQEERVKQDAQVFRALETLMGALPSTVTRYVDAWLEKHPLEWIFKAIDEAKAHNARSEKYVDKILIGWEANGYPKSRDEQVKEARKSPAAKQSQTDAAIAAFLAKHQQEQPNV